MAETDLEPSSSSGLKQLAQHRTRHLPPMCCAMLGLLSHNAEALMAEQPRSAAASIYPHLPTAERPLSTQRERSLGDAMWPSLSREARQREADQALWQRLHEHNRQVLRRGLREAVANLDKGRR
jgi:hypothetical protein